MQQDTDLEHPLGTNELLIRLNELGFKADRHTMARDIDVLNSQGYEVMLVKSGNVTAFRYLREMSEIVMLTYRDGEIHTEVIDKFHTDMNVVGSLSASVPAGTPDMVDDVFVEEYFPLPSALLRGLSGKFYMMPVIGQSMVDAGVDDGDYVIFKEDSIPKLGDIVVAYVPENGNTLKRHCKDKKGTYLWAENESWSDEKRMYGRQFEVKGVAIKVLKDM